MKSFYVSSSSFIPSQLTFFMVNYLQIKSKLISYLTSKFNIFSLIFFQVNKSQVMLVEPREEKFPCNKILIYAFKNFFLSQLFHFVFKTILPRINLTFITWHLFKLFYSSSNIVKVRNFLLHCLLLHMKREQRVKGNFFIPSRHVSMQSFCFLNTVCRLEGSVNFYRLTFLPPMFGVCLKLHDMRSSSTIMSISWYGISLEYFFLFSIYS